MAKHVDEFIHELERENELFFSDLGDKDTTYWPSRMDRLAAAEALKPRWFNELRGVEVIGRFIQRVPDLSLKVLVGRQVGDEAKHARVCRLRIEALGASVLDFEPTPAQLEFGDVLDAMAYPEEFFSAQQFTVETQSIKRNEKALARLDEETAEMFEKHINKDEVFHSKLGRMGLRVFARTEVAQERARKAAELIRLVHVKMVREHVERMGRLGFLH